MAVYVLRAHQKDDFYVHSLLQSLEVERATARSRRAAHAAHAGRGGVAAGAACCRAAQGAHQGRGEEMMDAAERSTGRRLWPGCCTTVSTCARTHPRQPIGVWPAGCSTARGLQTLGEVVVRGGPSRLALNGPAILGDAGRSTATSAWRPLAPRSTRRGSGARCAKPLSSPLSDSRRLLLLMLGVVAPFLLR